MIRDKRWSILYKGFTIIQVHGYYRAESYCSPQMNSKNLSKLKLKIKKYLVYEQEVFCKTN
jgi:hypothetical protein